MDSLVSTEWLARHLGEEDLAIVDCSWFMPAAGRSGHEEYLASHIPGARFLDIDEVADKSNPAPHSLPSAADFSAAMQRLGVNRDDRIVVYDNSPPRTAARLAGLALRRELRLDVRGQRLDKQTALQRVLLGVRVPTEGARTSRVPFAFAPRRYRHDTVPRR